jgi:hypothetical protein
LKLPLSAVLTLLLAGFAGGQNPGNQQPSVIMAPVGQVQLRAGASTNVEMAFRIGEGFHINSSKPHSDFLIPTQLKLSVPPQVTLADVKYPAGKDESFPFSPNEELSVYTGDFSIDAVLKAPAQATPGVYPVKGELTYQACDKAACYPPRTLPVQFQLMVVKK